MKPNFALDLSPDGIGLYHRSANGVWLEIGSVPLDHPKLREELSFLRKTATGISGRGFATKVVIPDSQVMYAEVRAPGPTDDDRRAQIRAALEGATPYAVDDLAFDWTGDGEVLQLAVVARETLDEAEEFAVDHRMNPVCIVAAPQPEDFAGEPFFGRTDFAVALLGPKTVVEPDTAPFRASGRLLKDAPPVAAAPVAAPSAPADPSAEDADEPIASAESPDLEALIAPIVREVHDDAEPAPARPGLATRWRTAGAGVLGGLRGLLAPLGRIVPAARAGVASVSLAAAGALRGAAARVGRKPADDTGPTFTHADPPTVAAESLPDTPAAPEPDTTEPLAANEATEPGPVVFSSRRARAAAAILLGIGIAGGAAAYLGLRGSDDVRIAAPAPADADRPAATPAAAVATATAPADEPEPAPAPRTVITANTASPTLDIPPAIRPVPRPEERVPDTAEVVTQLSPDELAAIQAAGLPVPAGVEFDQVAASRQPLATDPDTGAQVGTPVMFIPRLPDGDWGSAVSGFDPPNPPADPVALPPLAEAADPAMHAVPLPPAPGVTFDFDENGLVRPTADGAVTPDGVIVRTGKPVITPPEKPIPPEVERQLKLSAARPRARPDDLERRFLTAKFGGRTPEELAEIRPRARPASDQLLAALEEGGTTPTEQAVTTSKVPHGRPENFAETVEKQREARRVAAAAAGRESGGSAGGDASSAPALVIPTRASIAERATIKNAINLSQLNLIGVYGKSTDRRALMRMPSGRFVKVKVGDRLDGGKIAAISSNSVSYVKGGNAKVLKVPN